MRRWERGNAAGFVRIFVLAIALAPVATLGAVPATKPASMPDDQAFWMNHVELVLERNCFKCHGGVKQKGGLDLRLPSSVFQGGDDGSVVMPGRPDDSQLYQRILPGAKDHMPPDE